MRNHRRLATRLTAIVVLCAAAWASRVTCAADRSQNNAPPSAKAPFDAQQAKIFQTKWAQYLGMKVESTNSLGTTMVLIPPGKFLMGSSDAQVKAALKVAAELKVDQRTQDRIRTQERPQHNMKIAQPFLLAATEVTIAQFRKFVEATDYVTEADMLETGNSAAPNKAGSWQASASISTNPSTNL